MHTLDTTRDRPSIALAGQIRRSMPQQTLGQRFRERVPKRSGEDLHAWLNAEEQRFILWALRDRWSAARIGRALGVNAATVRRFRMKYWEDPELLLDLQLYEMAGRSVENLFRCLVCGDRVKGRKDMDSHLLTHFLDLEVVDDTMYKRQYKYE